MKKMKKSVLLLLILSLFITAIASLSPVYAQATALNVSPPAVVGEEYVPGTWFTVDVTVEEVSNLFGFEFKLKYNASLLDVSEITLGDLFPLPIVYGPSTYGASIIWHEEIIEINDLGYVWHSVSLGELAPTYPFGISGSGTLATINFTVSDEGGTILDLCDTKLSDPDGNTIFHEVYDGLFTNEKEPPVAIFTASDFAPEVNEPVDFNAEASYDPDYPEVGGYIVRYDWDFGDGGTATTTEPYADWKYDAVGIYTVILVVTDDMGAQGKAEVTIEVVPPTPLKADLAEWKAKPKHHHHDISKHGTIAAFLAEVQNLGDLSVTVKVSFTVYAGRGGALVTSFETDTYTFTDGTYLDIHIFDTSTDVSPPEFDTSRGTGRYYVEAQCFYKDGAMWVGGKIKFFSFAVVP